MTTRRTTPRTGLLIAMVVMLALALGGGAYAVLSRAAASPRSEAPTLPPSGSASVAGAAPSVTLTLTPPPTPKPVPAGGSGKYVFPVAGSVSYAREHHDYPATDIMAACGLTVRAVTDGTILEVERQDLYQPKVNAGATRGGLSVSLLGDDGVRYYGSHLRSIQPGIDAGVRVTAGQTLGVVGRTGDASACHLHFGISPVCAGTGDWWIRRGVVWPWSFLDSWRAGRAASAVSVVAAYSRAHGCPPVTAVPDG